MSEPKPIVIADLRGGRNGTDPPFSLPFNQCVDAVNVDWKDTTVAHKRGGSIAVSTTGGTAFSANIVTLIRHVPGALETAAELWAIDGSLTHNKRLTGGTSFADVTFDDAISTAGQSMMGASLNGKLFLAYDTTVDRLHVYDPNLASPRVRRVGINQGTNAPTAANNGGGAYAATLRYYRVRFIQWSGSGTSPYRRSEATPTVSFTPSGAGLNVRVTRPTAPGEGETHWELEASTDAATWYVVFGLGSGAFSPVAIATTTTDDGSTSYTSYPLSDAAGTYSLFPSVQSLISDGNRLIGLGAWESAGATSGGKTSRLWVTPVLGSTDHADDERVSMTTTIKGFFDINENDGGFGTGLGGPLNGIPYAFKYRQVWKLRPTGDVTAPYLPRKIRDDVGCIAQKSIAMGEDQIGRACLYFMSHRGPYRVTLDGDIQYVGRDNEDLWRTMNLGATVVSHSTYYPDLHQWWVWIATGVNTTPDTKLMFDVQLGFPDEHGQIRGGWARHTGLSAAAQCSCLFSNTLGASMSRDLKPHVGRAADTVLLKCDTSDLDDNGTAYQAFVTSRPLLTTVDLLKKVGVEESTLVTKAQAGTNLSVTINRDFGKETRVQTVSIAAAGSETRVVQKIGASEMGETDAVQMTIGDASALANTWTVDALITPVKVQERR